MYPVHVEEEKYEFWIILGNAFIKYFLLEFTNHSNVLKVL